MSNSDVSHIEGIDSLDLAKWICAWLVVTIHARPFVTYSRIVNLYVSQGICRFAVPLFLATSGFLLIRKVRQAERTQRNYQKVLLQYEYRIVAMYITWSTVYYLYFLQSWAADGKLTKLFILKQIRLFFLEASHYHLWYLLAMLYAVPLVYGLYRAGRKWQYAALACIWPFRCLQYAYSWTGIFADQYSWMQKNCDAVFNVILCAVPLMTLGVLALDDHKRYENKVWLRKMMLWLGIYMAELTCNYLLSHKGEHFEFLFSTPCLIYYMFCWLLTVDFRFTNATAPIFLRLSSEWIYCVHPLIILVFSIFSGDVGITRFAIVCVLCAITSAGYALGKIKKRA